ncbi:MAG: phosphatase PAP2 family protein [Bilifractor sp.]|nr:phosphatase PAP2 family protein [Lachnospiraceae bacterium]MDY2838586.1 phosphatase PAP2 family protein [Bilifractor sp.]
MLTPVAALFRSRKQYWILPVYAVFYFTVFRFLEKTIRNPGSYHLIYCPLDRYIPFNEYFVVFYFSWFVFMFLSFGFFTAINRDVQEYNRFLLYLFTGMTIFLILSAVYPNGLNIRPDVLPNNNIFSRMVATLYRTDTPTNVFPSIHVYNSLSAALAVNNCKALRKYRGLRIGTFVLAFLIILSTMFLKQHSVYDVAGGIFMSIIFYRLIYQPADETELDNQPERFVPSGR